MRKLALLALVALSVGVPDVPASKDALGTKLGQLEKMVDEMKVRKCSKRFVRGSGCSLPAGKEYENTKRCGRGGRCKNNEGTIYGGFQQGTCECIP